MKRAQQKTLEDMIKQSHQPISRLNFGQGRAKKIISNKVVKLLKEQQSGALKCL
jgi:hypothetical protein